MSVGSGRATNRADYLMIMPNNTIVPIWPFRRILEIEARRCELLCNVRKAIWPR